MIKMKGTKKTKYNYFFFESIDTHDKYISSISIFSSGNIILLSLDGTIILYDTNYNILQQIQNKNESLINIDIIDENNFVTCSIYGNIILWIKVENQFIINHIIKNAHNAQVNKVIYFPNNNLISCSYDKTVKIWETINNKYQLKTIFNNSDNIWSLLLLKDKNILIFSGDNGTKLWNINNFELIIYFEKVKCRLWNSLVRIDEDRIIIGEKSLNIISISNKRIIKEIKIPFICYAIKIIEKEGIMFIGGEKKDILIFSCSNYDLIQTIKNTHNGFIYGFTQLKNNSIASFSDDKTIKIWTFN